MRRALTASALTVVGLGALASFHSTSPLGRSATAHAATAPATTTRPAARPVTRTPATTPPATPPPPTAPPATQAPATSPATSPPATAPPASGKNGTFTGDPFDNQYGTVQLSITVQDGKITAINELQMPDSHQRSAYISEQAGPMLQQEALQAQSANIDLISGATYTSQSYAQSLQSALDRAGI